MPHGHSVIVTAPAAFRFTYEAMPERHHHVAELLAGERIVHPGPDTLPGVLLDLMRDVGAPSGVAELGYTEDDVPGARRGRAQAAAAARRRAARGRRRGPRAHPHGVTVSVALTPPNANASA